MSRWILCSWLALLFFWTKDVNAQFEYAASLISDSLLANVHTVIRKDILDITVKSPSEMNCKAVFAVTILNDQSGANIYYKSFDAKTKIDAFNAKLFDASGVRIKSFSKRDAANINAISSYSIYEDDRVLAHEIIHNEYPYTIEFEISYKQTAILDLPDFSFNSYRKSLVHARNSITVPKDLNIKYELRNGAPEPTILNSGKEISYTWEVRNLVGQKWEPFSPTADQLFPFVSIVPLQFKYDNWEGSTESWNSFGKFFYALGEDRDQVSPVLTEKVKQLTEGLATDEEKIKVLYNFLQKSTRYVSVQLGIGGWQPFDASYVEENEYGDCKALSNYMHALLKIVGITSYPAIIYNSSKRKPSLKPDFPKLFGNHMILYVPDSETWLECTSSSLPPNYIGEGNSNRMALLLKPEGGELISTPALNADENMLHRKGIVQLNLDGSVNLEVQFKFTGSLHDRWRAIAKESTNKEQRSEFGEYIGLNNCKVEQLSIEVNSDQPEVTIAATLIIEKYMRKIGKRLVLPLNIFGDSPEVPEKIENRKFPVVHRKNYKILDELSYQLPALYTTETRDLEPVEIKTSFGAYSNKINNLEGNLAFERALNFAQNQLPAERYEDLRTFYQKIQKADQPKILLNPL